MVLRFAAILIINLTFNIMTLGMKPGRPQRKIQTDGSTAAREGSAGTVFMQLLFGGNSRLSISY